MPERPRRRKYNRNKRKQNKNNKSEHTDAHSSVSYIQTNTDCTNNEDSETSVNQDANSSNLIKDVVDDLEDTCSSHQAVVSKDVIAEKETGNSENIQNSTCITSIDSSLTESEIDLNEDLKNKQFKSEHNTCDNIHFESKGEDSNIKSECSENTNINKSVILIDNILGINQNENNFGSKNIESLNTYLVESPDQQTQHTNKQSKLSNNVKSKSVDNDDSPTIIEVTDEDVNNDSDTSLCVIGSNNVIITDADSDVEWQKTDDFKDSNTIPTTNVIKVLSVSSIPLNIAECNQANTLKPEDERSLRNFLQTLNLSTNPEDSNTLEIKAEIEHIINREIKHRLRKRGLADDFLFQKAGPSRSLTVIDEEGSSESSITSRRQSYLSDKVSDNEELDDDVFVADVSQALKHNERRHRQNKSGVQFRAIPQECIRVDAKLRNPEITEASGNWTVKTTEKLTGAELVYLTDSSSSTSSLYDLNDENDNKSDTDMSVRIITPTIEVTDTEKFLTNTHIQNNNNSNTNLSDKESKHEKARFVDSHEIVVKSTDNIKTNLFVKELSDDTMPKVIPDSENKITTASDKSPKIADKYDLEIKVIKCELNDAINNLLKEVSSDSECIQSEDLLPRQDSSSSLGSSQCTAKYNPNHSSLNDVANFVNDDNNEVYPKTNHVKEVYDHVIKEKSESTGETRLNVIKQPQCLKDFCLKKISSFPYGDKIIEELANVSQRLQQISIQNSKHNIDTKKVLDLSDISLQNKREKLKQADNLEHQPIPPPVKPRTSSFKITKEEPNHELLPRCDPIYKCLSPSNKMLMEKTNTVLSTKTQCHSDFKKNKFDHIRSASKNKNVDERKESYPLKFETGSRLLSLIRDTSLKNNSISTPYKYDKNENLERISKINFSEPFRNQYSQSSDNYKSSLINSHKRFASEIFRPIPPPKLRTFSSSFYESDDSSDLTENSLRKMHNERRYFHYSTGNLSKDIENDVSSIQNMHRHYKNLRDEESESRPRRPSLPKDLCDKQMEYIRQKEKEVDAEIRRIEHENESSKYKRSPRAPMITEESFERTSLSSSYKKPVMKDLHVYRSEKRQMSSLFNSSEEELHREKMYSEYVSQMAEREKRREQKIIKITKPSPKETANTISKSMSALDVIDSRANNPIESEFITKARERWNKLGIKDPEPESDKECDVYKEPKIIEHKIKVIDAGEEKDVKKLPSHLQEFVSFTVKDKERKNSPGESDPEKTSAHVVILCAVIILMLTVGRYFMRLIRNI